MYLSDGIQSIARDRVCSLKPEAATPKFKLP
jgi:hypothetical protein